MTRYIEDVELYAKVLDRSLLNDSNLETSINVTTNDGAVWCGDGYATLTLGLNDAGYYDVAIGAYAGDDDSTDNPDQLWVSVDFKSVRDAMNYYLTLLGDNPVFTYITPEFIEEVLGEFDVVEVHRIAKGLYSNWGTEVKQ